MSLLLSRLSKLSSLKTPTLRHLTARSFSFSFWENVSSSTGSTLSNGDVGYLKIFKYRDGELAEEPETIGSSEGWYAILKEGVVCLEKGNVPDADRKHISLPPLVTLPHCQTQIVTNIAMSSFDPEDDDDCVLAIKFLGPQLSLCRPARKNPEWTNIRITDPFFFNSRVMYSEKDDMFSMPASGGNYIGSWNVGLGEALEDTHRHKLKQLRFRQFPEMVQPEWELLDSFRTSEYLVESGPRGKTYLVKWYTKSHFRRKGRAETQRFIVFKIDDEGNAEYTTYIESRNIFLHYKFGAFFAELDEYSNVICFKSLDDYGVAHLGDPLESVCGL